MNAYQSNGLSKLRIKHVIYDSALYCIAGHQQYGCDYKLPHIWEQRAKLIANDWLDCNHKKSKPFGVSPEDSD